MATVAVVLGVTQPALAMEAAPPPPAETASSTEAAPETTPPAAEQTNPEPATPPAEPTAEEPAAEEPPANPTPATDGGTATSTETPAPEAAPSDVVKLDPTPAPTTAPAATAPAPAESAAAPPPAAVETPAAPAPVTVVLLVEAPSAEEPAEADAPNTAAAGAEAVAGAAAAVVSLRERAAAPLIALVPDDETSNPLAMPKLVVVSSKAKLFPRACAQPRARVPLSQWCKQARAAIILRIPLTYSPSPEVRAAIDRVAKRAAARRVEARPPPDSKAAKKHPVTEARPTIPFGDSGQGAANDEFGGSAGSSWSSRLFAVTAVQTRVPMPFRFGRVRLPRTIPHGVIAAPPTARPG